MALRADRLQPLESMPEALVNTARYLEEFDEELTQRAELGQEIAEEQKLLIANSLADIALRAYNMISYLGSKEGLERITGVQALTPIPSINNPSEVSGTKDENETLITDNIYFKLILPLAEPHKGRTKAKITIEENKRISAGDEYIDLDEFDTLVTNLLFERKKFSLTSIVDKLNLNEDQKIKAQRSTADMLRLLNRNVPDAVTKEGHSIYTTYQLNSKITIKDERDPETLIAELERHAPFLVLGVTPE